MKNKLTIRIIAIIMIIVGAWNSLNADNTYLFITSTIVVMAGLTILIVSFIKKNQSPQEPAPPTTEQQSSPQNPEQQSQPTPPEKPKA